MRGHIKAACSSSVSTTRQHSTSPAGLSGPCVACPLPPSHVLLDLVAEVTVRRERGGEADRSDAHERQREPLSAGSGTMLEIIVRQPPREVARLVCKASVGGRCGCQAACIPNIRASFLTNHMHTDTRVCIQETALTTTCAHTPGHRDGEHGTAEEHVRGPSLESKC